MNPKLDHASRSRFTFHLLFCFLLPAFPLRAQVWITNSLTISETNTTYEGQDLIISGTGVTVAMDGPHAFNSLLLTNAAVLTHSPCTATVTYKLDLAVTNALTVSTNSRIDVTGLGYVAGRTTGNTTSGASTGFSGGSYGGLGSDGSGTANAAYGDYRNADDWGSGGSTQSGIGAFAGGGRVRLVAGSLQLDGQLWANGGQGNGPSGSGGGIYVDVAVLRGSGSVRAWGGNGMEYCHGGGGRIAVYAGDYSGFNISNITALGGTGNGPSAGAGTVYVRDSSQSVGTLVVDAGSGGNGWTPLGLQGTNRTVISDLVVIRGANTHVQPVNTDWVLEFATNVTISGGAQVSLTASNTVLRAPLVVNGSVVSVSGGLLDVPVPLVVTNNGQVNVTGDVNLHVPVTLSGGGLLQVSGAVASSVPVTVDGSTLAADYLAAPAVSLVNTGLLTCLASTASQMHKLDVEVAGTVLVSTNSRIDVSGLGYVAGRTSGNTTSGASTGFSGGSYGGLGSDGSGTANAAYGDYRKADDWGSGGSTQSGIGAFAGGGRVRLVAGSLQLDGQLWANGGQGNGPSGSGGGIYVDVAVLSGSGSVRAWGGNGMEYCHGGGGRIAVYAGDYGGFNISNITALGGTGNGPSAGAGTVYVRDSSQSVGTLVVDAGSGGNGWTPLGLPGTNYFAVPDAVVVRGSRTQVQTEHAGLTLDLQQSLTVQQSGYLVVNGVLSMQGSGVLTVASGGRLDVNGSAVLGVPLALSNGGLWQVNGSVTSTVPVTVDGSRLTADFLAAPAVSLVNTGVLSCLASTASQMHKLELNVAGAVAVDSSSRIDVSGLGYVGGHTKGNTTVGASTGFSGGSYGGLGGDAGTANAVYGDYREADDWGSGGSTGSGITAFAGGGRVRLVGGSLQLDGQLLANGGGGDGVAGSGGGIYLSVGVLSGSGSVRAWGGGSTSGYRAGGGGRIAVYAGDYSGFILANLTALGSTGNGTQGGAGSVYVRRNADPFGTLLIDGTGGGNGWAVLGLPGTNYFAVPDALVLRGSQTQVQTEHAGLTLDLQQSLTVESGYMVVNGVLDLQGSGMLTLARGGRLTVNGPVTSSVPVTVDGSTLTADYLVAPVLSLVNTGVLACLASTASQMHKLEVNVSGTVMVDGTSKIDVSGKGYLPQRTMGNTLVGGATQASGGSYGGLGGSWAGSPNAIYGDYADPEDWGSGGGDWQQNGGYRIGTGGGLVRLEGGSLRLDGQVSADGTAGESGNGGGSGGGISISVNTLSGSGEVSAGGGVCGNSSGGGGRVAVYAADWSGFNLTNITALGGASGAGAGTVWLVNGLARTHVRYTLPGLQTLYPTNGLTYLARSLTNGVSFQFNKPINTNSYSPDKFLIQGPLGAIVPTGLSQVGDRLYRIAFPPQTENGYYYFTLLPTLLDADGFQLDQNANGIPGEADDGYNFTLVLDTVPPRVMPFGPQGDILGTFSYFDFSFSEAINTNTLATSQITLVAPTNAAVAPALLQTLGTNRWRALFPPQIDPGNYTLRIGPGIQDLAGNSFDENGNGVQGEAGDAFQANIRILPLELAHPTNFVGRFQVSYRFNGGGCPPGDVHQYNPHFCQTPGLPPGPYFLDLPPGRYRLVSTGASTNYSCSIWDGDETNGVSYRYALGYFAGATFEFEHNLGGIALFGWDWYSGDNSPEYWTEFDLFYSPQPTPRVLASSPAGAVPDVSRIQLVFNRPIGADLANWTNFVREGPLGAQLPLAVTNLAERTVEVTFPLATANGSYRFTLLPTFIDAVGVLLDQNHNETPGEPEDAYSFTLILDTVPPRVAQFTPLGPLLGSFGYFDFEFSEPIDSTTLTTSQVTITGPTNPAISLALLQQLATNRFRAVFVPQIQPGDYVVRIGPGIRDLAGNAFDENHNGVLGEPQDAFQTTVHILPLELAHPTDFIGRFQVSYRFNAGGCPPGDAHEYNPHFCRDPVLLPGPYFLDLPPGHYRLVSTGATTNYACSVWDGDETNGVSYRYAVGYAAGTTFEFDHYFGGIALYGWDWVAGDNPADYWTELDMFFTPPPAPAVLARTPSGSVRDVSRVRLVFNRAVATNLLTWSNFVRQGPLSAEVPLTVALPSERVADVTFPTATENGPYHFDLSPDFVDAASIRLDQNTNGIPGEADDAYNFTLILDTVPPRITHHEPEGDVAGTASSVDVWFSEEIDTNTINTAGVTIHNPTNATVAATSVTEVGLNRWRISFPPQTATGTYQLSISTNVTDLAGNPVTTDSGPLTFNLVPVDLQLSNVTVSTNQLTAGDVVTVSWTGRNATGVPLLGDWTDAVYLSTDNHWDLGDVQVGTVSHTGGLTTNEVYTAQTTFFVPGLLLGNYYFVIRTDIYDQEKEPSGHTGNQATSLPLPLTVPSINPNGGAFSGVLTPGEPSAWFAIQLAPGQNLGLYLHGLGGSSATELYASFGSIPTRLNYDYGSVSGETDLNRQDQQLAVTTPPGGGTVYVLVYGDGIGSSNPFQLFASSGTFLVTSITPDRISNKQPLGYLPEGFQYAGPPSGCVIPSSVTVSGAGFDKTTSVQFIAPNGAVQTATVTHLISPSTLVLDLSPTNWPPGLYNVQILKAGDSYTRTNAFTIVQNGMPNLQTHLIVPSAVGFNIPIRQTIWLEYTNAGDAAMPAPLLKLHGDYDALLTPDPALAIPFSGFNGAPPGVSDTVQVMAKGSGATPGTLQPGDSGRIPVYYIGLGQHASYPNVTFSLSALTADDVSWLAVFTAVGSGAGGGGGGGSSFMSADWHIPWSDSFATTNRPDSIPLDAWLAISANLQTQLGPEWGNYVEALANDMNYLESVGQDVADVGQLWNFEVAKASASLTPVSTLASSVDASAPSPGFPLVFRRVYGQSIISRYRLGPLGRGWSHNWEVSLQVSGDGSVTVLGPSGSVRLFTFKNGRFYDSTGDYGTLTSSGGAYRIAETDQTVWQFRADNLLDYVQDNNSNRITCGYTSGLLTTLTHSSGKQFLLDYDGNGRLWHLTDPLGPGSADDRVTTYQYDASGQHLLTVSKPGSRTTTYAYDSTTSVLQRSHALTFVINPDNTTNTFAYDDSGRLTQTAKGCCGGSPITFVYDPNGMVTVVDATSRTNVVSYGLDAQIGQVRDGAGRIVNFSYDGTNQLTQLLGPAGEQYRYSYGANGNLTAVQDPLRHSSSFAFDPVRNRLAEVTDARYNSMQYRRDSQGNVTSIVYADNSHEDFGYDGYGNVLTYTNRRRSVINYAYNSAGQLTDKNYLAAQGRVDFNYSYDAAGNLRTAIGPEGTHSLDYYPNTDWLQRIAYPGGQWFTFEYDAVGRRTKRTDQDGNVVGYVYDAQGRLDTMTNGMGQLIVNYQYDGAGRLHHKTLGNGVYTTYDYNSAGQVTNLVNAKADSTVLSAYAYGYDGSGRRTSMAVNQPRPGLPGGSWTETYGYDPLGELTSIDYSAPPNGTQGVSSVTYAYDAAGNRTQVQGDGGTAFTDVYAANTLNQYSSAGAATFSYDADGNLTTNTESSVATAYGYDAENRLVSMTTPTDAWTYTYDSFGNRIATTHNGAATRYVIDPVGLGNVAAEYDGVGNLLAHYDHGFGLLDRVDAEGQPDYYTFTAIGHTAELTDSGSVPVNTYAFDPWGLPLRKAEAVPNAFQFTGEFGVVREANGMDFMRNRFYESARGRFTQDDPAQIQGGLNLRAYVSNMPTGRVDPTGLGVMDSLPRDLPIVNPVTEELGLIALDLLLPEAAAPVLLWGHVALPALHVIIEANGWNNEYVPGQTMHSGAVMRSDEPTWRAYPGSDRWWQTDPTEPKWEPYRHWLGPNDLPLNWPSNPLISDTLTNVHSFDPNDKRGPNGVGAGHFVRSGDSLSYQVSFENETGATAPARLVTITDVLDASLDLNTFELSEIAFGSQFISVAPGLNHYESMEYMNANGTTIAVDIQAALNINTRTLTVTLSALDPTTGWYPEDPLVGLLYPEDGTGRGTGSVTYRVRPLAGLSSGTVIRNRATIVFDYNDPIQTPEVFNTLDSGAPTSSVQPLPVLSGTTFQIQWSGQDDPGGIGIADYTIFASVNGTNYVPWLQTGSSGFASFRGTPGNNYFFYSIARDLVGNAQPTPLGPDAFTTIPTNAPVLASVTNFTIRPGDNLSITNQVLLGKPLVAWLFSLDAGAPAGASVDATIGIIHWTPTCGQASTTNQITVRVTDSGWTNMTDAVSFTVAVGDCVQPGLGQQIVLAGSSGRVPIWLISSVPLTNLEMTLVSPPGRLVSFSVEPIVPQICASSITPLTNSFQQLNLTACANQWLIGTQQVAWLNFTAATNQSSAFVSLQFMDLRGYEPDGTPVANFAPQAGRVVVVGEEPLLECVRGTNAQPQLILYSQPAMTCAIEWRADLVVGNWGSVLTGLTMPTNLWLSVSPPPSGSAVNFYRAAGTLPPSP